MKISLDWISDYVNLKGPAGRAGTRPPAHAEDGRSRGHRGPRRRPGRRGRRVRDGAAEPAGPGSSVVRCDVGAGRTVVVVTRAANLTIGAAVAVALPGVRLNGREIGPAEVDGVVSEAYLGRAADLGLAQLFWLPGSLMPWWLDEPARTAGSPLADAVWWRDVVLEADNRSGTNRPDLWGHHGVAREFSAILGLPLAGPVPGTKAPRPAPTSGLIGTIDPAVCQRMAVAELELDDQVPSPLWLRSRLARIGEGSVSLLVDLGNYVMFATGQPVHVYDADRITLPLSAVTPTAPLEMDLLNGQHIRLPEGAGAIRDANEPVGLAGIMGGAPSAVSAGSRRFLLEVATFAPRVIRRGAQRTGLRTEASARYEKGLDTQRVDQALDLYLTLLARLRTRSPHRGHAGPRPRSHAHQAEVEVDLDFLTKRIGMRLERARIRPSWRGSASTSAATARG